MKNKEDLKISLLRTGSLKRDPKIHGGELTFSSSRLTFDELWDWIEAYKNEAVEEGKKEERERTASYLMARFRMEHEEMLKRAIDSGDEELAKIAGSILGTSQRILESLSPQPEKEVKGEE